MRMGRSRARRGRRVVVIGAGPGGLASAMLARAAGAQVTVLERAPRVGGRTTAIEHDGFVFDTGPTFFLYPQIARGIFAACCLDFDAMVPMTRLDPMYRLRFDDGRTFDATPDVGRLRAEVARIDPEESATSRTTWPRTSPSSRRSGRSCRSRSWGLAPSRTSTWCGRSRICGPGPRWTRT